jgi:hypothetical protein
MRSIVRIIAGTYLLLITGFLSAWFYSPCHIEGHLEMVRMHGRDWAGGWNRSTLTLTIFWKKIHIIEPSDETSALCHTILDCIYLATACVYACLLLLIVVLINLFVVERQKEKVRVVLA